DELLDAVEPPLDAAGFADVAAALLEPPDFDALPHPASAMARTSATAITHLRARLLLMTPPPPISHTRRQYRHMSRSHQPISSSRSLSTLSVALQRPRPPGSRRRR